MRIVTILGVLALAACGGGKDAGPGKDWSGRPLDQTIASQVNGVAFTVQAPAGMKLEGEDTPTEITKRWRADVDDYFSEPGFSVAYASIPPKDVAGFIADQMIDEGDVIVKQETLPADGGFLVVHHTAKKGLAYARVLKRQGEHHLTCTASQAKDGGLPSFDQTLAWLERLCLSLTIQ